SWDVRVTPVDHPASTTSCAGLLNASMLFTVLDFPDGWNTTLSPTRSEPDSTRPAVIRRSSPPAVNLYTSWTGMRNGCASLDGAFSKASMAASRSGPLYQGIFSGA